MVCWALQQPACRDHVSFVGLFPFLGVVLIRGKLSPHRKAEQTRIYHLLKMPARRSTSGKENPSEAFLEEPRLPNPGKLGGDGRRSQLPHSQSSSCPCWSGEVWWAVGVRLGSQGTQLVGWQPMAR